MIVGTGVDICEVSRIAASISRFGERFLRRCFTPAEIAYCNAKPHPAERLAARFAAKEAAMKAIGTGLSHGVTWQDFEVVHTPGGRPELRLAGNAAHFAARMGAHRTHLSLSHDKGQAIAFVILESD